MTFCHLPRRGHEMPTNLFTISATVLVVFLVLGALGKWMVQ